MSLANALKIVKRQRRWHCQGSRAGDMRGMYIAALLPSATRTQIRLAARTAKRPNRVQVKWVEVAKLRSEQNWVRRARVMWHLRNYARMQQNKKYPCVVFVRGVPLVWDGNHRTTSALLLGRKRIRCECYFAR